MSDDKCLKCGAELGHRVVPSDGVGVWTTQFIVGTDTEHTIENCLRCQLAQRDEQLAQSQAENERLRAIIVMDNCLRSH